MAGSTDLELNGVPVRAGAPLPVQLIGGGATPGDINAKQWGGAALAAALALDSTTAQDERLLAALVRAGLTGVDSGQAAGSQNRAIEARAVITQLTTGLYRLLDDSLIRGYEPVQDRNQVIIGTEEVSGNQVSMMVVAEGRRSGYYTSRRGRRFIVKSPNLTGVAAATGFVTTTPTYLLVNGSTNEAIIRRITVTLNAIGTSTGFAVAVKTDTADRFSAGGTTRTPATMNNGNVVAATQARSLEAPTATAEGGGTRDIDVQATPFTAATTSTQGKIEFLFEDGLVIAASGSLLVYAVTPTAGATVHYAIEYEDANIQ